MSADIKILSTRRISHERGRLGNMAMPIEVKKQADGKFLAVVRGQEAVLRGEGTSESDALYAVKQVIKNQMQGQGLQKLDQRMI